MTIFRSAPKVAFVVLAMTVSAGAWAVPMSNPVITGTHTVWGVAAPGTLAVVPSSAASIASALTGTAANPGGNIELSKFGGPVTTLGGDIAGIPITLSSLVLSDWTAGSDALATRYIQGAAMAAFGAGLNAGDLATALNAFYTLDVLPGPGVRNPWQLVSDPNISYVNGDSSGVSIGLAGLLDATAFLQGIVGALATVPAGSQASEVVKVTYNGMTDYLYGFSATSSGYQVANAPGVFSGNYEVKMVPEPTALWLLGVGLVGLMASRRRLPVVRAQ